MAARQLGTQRGICSCFLLPSSPQSRPDIDMVISHSNIKLKIRRNSTGSLEKQTKLKKFMSWRSASLLVHRHAVLQLVCLLSCRGGHRHLQIGRMLDIDLISEPPHTPSPPDLCIQSVGNCVPRGAGSDS
jgi:hypothetical protein